MKHFLFLTTLVLITTSANCQLDKKYWLVGGTGSFYSYNDDFTTTGQPTVSGKLTEINLSGNVGYFFLDKFVAGLQPGIKSLKSRGLNTASAAHKEVALYIGPFVRYYFLNSEKQYNIHLDGCYQIGTLSNFGGTGSFKTATVTKFNDVNIKQLVDIAYNSNSDHFKPEYKKIKSLFYPKQTSTSCPGIQPTQTTISAPSARTGTEAIS